MYRYILVPTTNERFSPSHGWVTAKPSPSKTPPYSCPNSTTSTYVILWRLYAVAASRTTRRKTSALLSQHGEKRNLARNQEKTKIIPLKNESTCDAQRKYLRWLLKVLSSTIASTFIFLGILLQKSFDMMQRFLQLFTYPKMKLTCASFHPLHPRVVSIPRP